MTLSNFTSAGLVLIRTALSPHPFRREQLRLLQHGLGGSFLLVGGITVFPQDAPHQHTKFGADVLPHDPVDIYVVADHVYQFSGYSPQRFVTQEFHRAAR